MKKEIQALINSDRGYLRINSTVTLHRWTESAVGEKVDKLEARVYFHSVPDEVVELSSRTYPEIINEVALAVMDAYNSVGERLYSEIKNGHATLEFDMPLYRIVCHDTDGTVDLTLSNDYSTYNYTRAQLVDIAKAWEEEDADGTRYEVEEYR